MLEGQGCLDEDPALPQPPSSSPSCVFASVTWTWWWFLPVWDSDFWRWSRMGRVVSPCSRRRRTVYTSLEGTVPHIGWQWGGAFWHHDWPWDQPSSIKCYQGKVRVRRWWMLWFPSGGQAIMTKGLVPAKHSLCVECIVCPVPSFEECRTIWALCVEAKGSPCSNKKQTFYAIEFFDTFCCCCYRQNLSHSHKAGVLIISFPDVMKSEL